ncbi:uncharacterized protein BYT42DRAFT_361737 [Radiomyces spectabilis]|uniref:uncharacterized protein n=1 Tax=Radiomyces spectabilis TaxID=64574 RepID=UPI00221E74EF|nr:uncharacterized protein BYT42DRAFT_361737 [Radiomyces spectabilis]KAI8377922.1 hypothetical protein BYT42DRAFT_361737 [Radiomyces spectabilis]
MSSQLWSMLLHPDEPFPVPMNGMLHLTMASLHDSNEKIKSGRHTLKVIVKDQEYVLCSLARNHVEFQALQHYFTPLDKAILVVSGKSPVTVTGTFYPYEDEDESQAMQDIQATQLPTYLSDLLGDDLPSDDSEDEFEGADAFGPLQFRDPTDNRFLGGFQLCHFGLSNQFLPFDDINLRKEEESQEDTQLHDNIASGLINALLNSGDAFQVKQGKQLLKKLKKQQQQQQQQQQKLCT